MSSASPLHLKAICHFCYELYIHICLPCAKFASAIPVRVFAK